MVDFPNEADVEQESVPYTPVRPDRKCGFCKEYFQHSGCNAPNECDCPRCQGYCECC